MLKILCVWVQGNVPYSSEYVYRLRSMVGRTISRPHEFICLTDRPEQLQKLSGRTIEIPSPIGYPGWWSKLQLFNPRHELKGPGLYVDLDVLFASHDTAAIIDFPAKIAFVPHEGTFKGTDKLKVVKRYNSSVIKFEELSAFPQLYTKWSTSITKRLWGDQDWIGEQLPSEKMMPLSWFPRISSLDLSKGRSGFPGSARIILCKKPKNHELAKTHPWFDFAWK